MKKILSVCLIAAMLLVALTACGPTIEDYVANLEEAGYEIEVVEEEEMDDYADEMGLEADEASVERMLYGMKSGTIPKVILIMECVSDEAAEEIASSASALDSLSFLGISVEVDGKCVLVGSTDAVETAMGE